MSLTKEQVQHIAMLARLEVGEQEIDEVADKLTRIVDFVAQLEAAPTADVLPMAHPLDRTQRMRADEVTESNQRDRFQENAPVVRDSLYLVPKVIE